MAKLTFAELPLGGKAVQIIAEELQLPRAVDFVRLIGHSATAILIHCERVTADQPPTFKDGDEIVVFDVRVETGQQPAVDIRYTERIAVQFSAADDGIPWVYALRADFPQAPHMNSMTFRVPKSLCIYEKIWDEVKLTWRSAAFLEGIRRWLAGTAAGGLHQDDQPLEAFIIGTQGYINMPDTLEPGRKWNIQVISRRGDRQFNMSLIPHHPSNANANPFLVLHVELPPREHGVIGFTPRNMKDLAELFSSVGLSLQEVLRQKLLTEEKVFDKGNEALLESQLLLLCSMPKSTATGVEEMDHYAFLLLDTVREAGIKTGIFIQDSGIVGPSIIREPLDGTLASLSVLDVFVPQFPMTADLARKLTGVDSRVTRPDTAIVMIGAGALGSEVYVQSKKKRLGVWTLVDEDVVLPHNTVRHELGEDDVMAPKAPALANAVTRFTAGNVHELGVWENYLRPANPGRLNQLLTEAELILDVSTSIAVARDLALRTDTTAKRVSLFLNPSGLDLVILAEDRARTTTLDCLEHQYYRNLLYDERLKDHYRFPPAGVRYAGGCRDITGRISPDILSVEAGIAARKLEHIISADRAFMGVWQVDEASLAVTAIELTVAATTVQTISGWNIVTDLFVMEKINAHRQSRLPNETGGILVGAYDFSRRRIYIVDTILSPEDSEEYPTAYVRGIRGLKEALDVIRQKTAGHLLYVGEWHSHPDGHVVAMSDDDKKCFAWLETELSPKGFPALMLIAGNTQYEIFVTK